MLAPRQPWGKLVRSGGSERTEVLVDFQIPPLPVPSEILLVDSENFVGRMPNVDPTKFSHSHQTVVPLAYMSSTHFCVGIRASVYTGQPPTYYLMDHSRNDTSRRLYYFTIQSRSQVNLSFWNHWNCPCSLSCNACSCSHDPSDISNNSTCK